MVENLREHVVATVKGGGRERVLLYGPPQTGKTYVSRALANELGMDVRIIKSFPDELALNELALAPENQLLFIDCADELGGDLLETIFSSLTDRKIIVAASNTPWLLDGKILGYFTSTIFMSEPDIQAREGIIKTFLPAEIDDEAIHELALAAEYYTAGEIHKVIQAAEGNELEKAFKNTQPTTVKEWRGMAMENRDKMDEKLFKPLLGWLDG